MEELIKSITEAEEKALEIKNDAQQQAARILAEAEHKSAEIAKVCEAELKSLREKRIKEAEDAAQDNYDKTLKQNAVSAQAYADGVIKKTQKCVNDIVRRIVGGDC